MARRTPDRSSITRSQTVAYSRKSKTESDADDEVPNADVVKAALATMKTPAVTEPEKPVDKPKVKTPDGPEQDEVETSPARARVETVGMPVVPSFGAPPEMPVAGFGAPPEMPAARADETVPVKGGVVEDPTSMPGPRDVPSGDPEDLAPPPGHVPPGDSRSLRRRTNSYEFALIYRQGNAVIARYGVVGTRGVWRVVEYPTTASASHAYAKECSRFVSEGFSDYRD